MTDTVATYMHKAHLARQRQEEFAKVVQQRASEKPVTPPAIPAEGMDRLVEQAATGGLQDDSAMGMVTDLLTKGLISKQEYSKTTQDMAEAGKNLALGLPSEFAGGTTQLAASAVALGYNAIRMAQGDDFAWPEDFSDVPATSDFYGEILGADVSDFAFIGGALAITNPAKYTKFINKTLKAAKTLKGGRKAAVLQLENAKALDQEGLSREEIWQQTGWWKSKDKGWRFAISDADAKLRMDTVAAKVNKKYPTLSSGPTTIRMRTDELLEHPALFELYPEIAGYPITVGIEKLGDGRIVLADSQLHETVAGFNPTLGKQEFLLDIDQADARSAILHEVQHAIQQLEKFQGGANTGVLRDSIYNYRIASLMDDVIEHPTDYLHLEQTDLETAFFLAGADDVADDLSAALARTAEDLLRTPDSASDDVIRYWKTMKDKFANESARWLSTIDSQHNISRTIDELNYADIHSLADLRYYLDLGEMEARLVEATRNLSQAQLDNLKTDPHSLMKFLDGEGLQKLQQEGLPVDRMRFSRPVKDAVVDGTPPTSVVEEIRDVYLKPKYLLTDEKVRVEYLHNPSEAELKRWTAKRFKDTPKDWKQLRYIEDSEGNLTVWVSTDALHEDVGKALGIKPELMGESDVQGMLDALSTTEEGIFLGKGDDLEKIKTR